jgi:putative OmpL-like beta-barrel porin-2
MHCLLAIGGWGEHAGDPTSTTTRVVSLAIALVVTLLCARGGKVRRRPRSSGLRPGEWIMVVAVGLACARGTAHAQDAPPAPEPSPAAEPRLAFGASVDGVFAYNFNQPADQANFLPGLGTSAKRDNEATLNLAQVDMVLAPEPVGFKLSLGFGTAPEVVHAAEVRGPATSPDVWRHVLQASAQWQTGAGRGLLVEAGIYPSHIGFEGFAPKDNWNYTRSWLGELSPYYQAGLKLAYPFSGRWSGQLHLLNGWQVIGDNNRGKSVGAQLAYAADRFSVSFNGIAGPERAGNDDDTRLLGDVVATWKATPGLSLGVSVDAAREGRSEGDDVGWWGTGLYARLAPPQARTSLALRGEYYQDEDGAISGIAQTLKELTATLEHRPVPRLILRLEGRYDRSSAPAFADDTLDSDGAPFRKDDQLLLLLAAIATF